MKKLLWSTVLLTLTLGIATPSLTSAAEQPRRQQRVERLQEPRHRMQERRAERSRRLGPARMQQLRERRLARMDRNHDGRVSRREAIRHRLTVRRALRGIR